MSYHHKNVKQISIRLFKVDAYIYLMIILYVVLCVIDHCDII